MAALKSMLPGGVDAVVSAVVADRPAIRRNADGHPEQYHTPDAGEYLAATKNGILAHEKHGIRLVREAEEIKVGDPGIVLAIEGCRFVEGDLDRFDEMEARGIRSIQLAHYVVNEMCDIQTKPEVHGGLTSIGKAAVGRMNERGIIVDVAHCSEATVGPAWYCSSHMIDYGDGCLIKDSIAFELVRRTEPEAVRMFNR